jgi:nucleoside-diphosphate-sugar epimerase
VRILIVGGTGFIGARVARALDRAGHEVTVYHRGRTEPELPAGIRHLRDDDAAVPVLRYPTSLRAAGFDAVIHMVLLGAADARACAAAFAGHTGRLVAVSSGDVYAAYGRFAGTEPAGAPAGAARLTEDASLRSALYPHGRSAPSPWGEVHDYDKILAERELTAVAGLATAILRLPAVWGPGDPQRRFAAELAEMDAGRPVRLPRARAAWRWTHGYVDDVADAIALAAVHPAAAGRVYNVGEPETPTTLQRLQALGRAAGWSGDIELTGETEAGDIARTGGTAAALPDVAYDTARIRAELAFRERAAPGAAWDATIAWLRGKMAP